MVNMYLSLPKRMGWGLDKKGEFLKFKQNLHTYTKLQKYYKKKTYSADYDTHTDNFQRTEHLLE